MAREYPANPRHGGRESSAALCMHAVHSLWKGDKSALTSGISAIDSVSRTNYYWE